MITALQPIRRNCATTRLSRFLLPASFAVQYALLVFGFREPRLQPWPCQKQPCTKSATFGRGMTKSGRPGRSPLLRKNLNRKETSQRPTVSSGPVPDDLMARMMRDFASLGAFVFTFLRGDFDGALASHRVELFFSQPFEPGRLRHESPPQSGIHFALRDSLRKPGDDLRPPRRAGVRVPPEQRTASETTRPRSGLGSSHSRDGLGGSFSLRMALNALSFFAFA
jgi:hypothetical protein